MDTELIAYMAGLFDGEGSIYMTGRWHGATIAIKLTNTERILCQRLLENWGGNIQAVELKNEKHRTIFRWYIYGKKAKPFLLSIKPYSIIKTQLISLALEFINTIGYTKKGSALAYTRQAITDKIYKLNT